MSSNNAFVAWKNSQEIQLQSSINMLQPSLIISEEIKDDRISENITHLITNSVALNKKLHRQILEKEFLMKAQNNEASQKMSNTLRQMQDLYHRTQNFYEETVRQNQKARFLAEELIRPFREELRHKVDQTTLSLKLKLMLSQFDSLGHRISYDREGKVVSQDSSAALSFIKQDLLPIIASLQSRINILEANNEQQVKKIDQIIFKQVQNQTKVSHTGIKMDQLNKNFSSFQPRQFLIHQQIKDTYNKVNDNLVKQTQELNSKINMAKKEINDLKVKFQKATLFSKAQNDKNFKSSQDKYLEQVKEVIFGSLSDVKKQLQSLKVQANNYTLQLVAAKTIQAQKQQSQINGIIQEVNSIKQGQAEFAIKVQQQALNNINKSIISKVYKLQADTKNHHSLIKNFEQKIKLQQKELISVQNLLAQKANFSDFIRVIQMKADREDYRYLKDLIYIQNQTFTELKESDLQLQTSLQNSSFNGFKLRSKKILGTQRKMQTRSPTPVFKSTEKQESVKKYMLGLDSPAKRRSSKDRTELLFVTQSENRKWIIAKKDASQRRQQKTDFT